MYGPKPLIRHQETRSKDKVGHGLGGSLQEEAIHSFELRDFFQLLFPKETFDSKFRLHKEQSAGTAAAGRVFPAEEYKD